MEFKHQKQKTMVRGLVFPVAVIMFCCSHVTSQVCNQGCMMDPCNSTDEILITVSDNTTVGSAIATFTSSGVNITFKEPCSLFNMTDEANESKIVLNIDLQKPCFVSPQQCSMQCQNLQRRSNMVERSVKLLVYAINTDAPKFRNSTYTISVPENTTINSTIVDFGKEPLVPIDEDCTNQSFLFRRGQGGSNQLSIIPSGIVRNSQPLDYEQTRTHRLSVVATSGNDPETATTELIVEVIDVDDNTPTFDNTEYIINVTEESTTEWMTSFPPIHCYDQDLGVNATVVYAFKDSRNISAHLEMDSRTGRIRIHTAIDRETDPALRLDLLCYQEDDVKKTAAAVLIVTVLDVNDCAAEFQPTLYNVSLPEHSLGYVTKVRATDCDIGPNAEICYKIVSNTTGFSVGDTGVLSVDVRSAMDRETNGFIVILIAGEDRVGNRSSNTATVVITLLDINDRTPQFEESGYLFEATYTSPNAFIGTLSATDGDQNGTGNANVSYFIDESLSLGNVPFTVDGRTGNITVRGTVEYKGSYRFIAKACDNPADQSDRRCSLVPVSVIFDWNATFSYLKVNMKVPENVPIGTLIDAIPLKGNSYACLTTGFAVDNRSHMLMSTMPLDREQQETHQVDVLVLLDSQVLANVTVNLTVLDVNDNVPVFEEAQYFINLPFGGGSDFHLPTLNATDADKGVNSNITYSLRNGDTDMFTIDPMRGKLKTGPGWTNATISIFSLYRFEVFATDMGQPALSSSVPVVFSFLRTHEDGTVEIPVPIDKETFRRQSAKLQSSMARLLQVENVQMTHLEERKDRTGILMSIIQVGAFNSTNAAVRLGDLQRSITDNWAQIQDLFHTYMSLSSINTDADGSLSPAEMSLIAVAGVIFVGGLVAIVIICRQWNNHIKEHRLYDTLRRSSTMYSTQELSLDFYHDIPSGYSTHRRTQSDQSEHNYEFQSSFGLGIINSGYAVNDEDAPKTPIWSTISTPRIPRWTTTDSLKDAMESLDALTSRLNAEDTISGVTSISLERRSLKSAKSEPNSPRGCEMNSNQALKKAHSFSPASRNELNKKSPDGVYVNGSVVNEKDSPYENDVTAPDYAHRWGYVGYNDNIGDLPDENTITIGDYVNTKDTDHIIEECTAF
ncbi:protocadherin Fat 4-like [Dreissena polymorpha]|uniref:Cadherin domain-containing protein n=1 Tax=Dreissena polymorpha TaxID=45954 RepID=A0A9D4CZN8_DREPO|nr:protocadherin Fat 4-like [Dreissena polymorpha]KAH3735124.1 hypothetical protein DPMN_041586 [Dreissena polymorpha]